MSEDTHAVDWSVLEHEGVLEVVEQVAAKVAGTYAGIVEAEDLCQDAYLRLATNPDVVRGYLDDPHMGPRYLYQWLWSDLTDRTRTEASRSEKHVPLHEVLEIGETGERE